MKVVLFCGGLGLRLRDYSNTLPKPMVPIGQLPILWHVMKYYAHYGHTDFVLCLGYRGDAIKEFFLNYNECMSNDFVMSGNGANVKLASHDLRDWNITFVDTGPNASIGQRLQAVREHLDGEELFLANYSDGLTDLPLDDYVDYARKQDKTACFVSVHPTATFHAVQNQPDGLVTDIRPVSRSLRINCGYFVLKSSIFDHLGAEDDLVVEGFQSLIARRELVTYEYDGFWECMDTFKDRQDLEDMYSRGDTPWMVWK